MITENSLSAEFCIRLAIGSTIILGAGWFTILRMKTQSAATKHLVGSITFAGLLLLYCSSALLPCWKVGLIGNALPTAVQTSSPVGQAPENNQPSVNTTSLEHSDPVATAHSTAPPFVPSLDRNGNEATEPPQPVSIRLLNWSRIRSAVPGILLWAYFIGIVARALQLVRHHVAAAWLVRSSREIEIRRLPLLVQHSLTSGGTTRAVRIRVSKYVPVPMVTGLIQPVVLLPERSLHWPPDQLHWSLLHELAHIQRHDLFVQLACNLIATLYWPQLLVWALIKRMQVEREHACDDRALIESAPPAQYARHLLDMATELDERERRSNQASLAMARKSNVEARIIAVLETTRLRAPLSRFARIRLALALISISIAFAYVSPFPATELSSVHAQETTETQTPPIDQGRADVNRIEAASKPVHLFQGRVLLPNGEPAQRAKVASLPIGISHPAVEVETDPQGKYEIRLEARSYHSPLVVRDVSKEFMGFAELTVSSEEEENNLTMSIGDIRLKPPRVFAVQTINTSGDPIAGAAVLTQAGYGLLQRVLTDVSGHAEVIYPDGLKLQSVGAVKPGDGCDYRVFEDLSDQLDQTASKVTLILNGIRRATVEVVGPDGNPLQNISIRPSLIRKPQENDYWQPATTDFFRETNDQGLAEFDVIPVDQPRGVQFGMSLPRDDWFYVGDSSFGQPYIEWKDGGEAKTTVRVYEKVLVGGRVHFPDGRPAVGIKISVAGSTRYSGLYNDHVTSAPNGTWSALVKPNGYYLFAIRDEEYSAAAQQGIFVFEEDTPKDLDFVLEPPRKVFGKVSGPIDDRTYIRLYQRASDYYGLPPGPRLPEPPPGLRGSAVSVVIEDYRKVEADGSFEFSVGPGDYSIQGPDRKQQPFEIAHQPELEFNFQLDGPLRIATRFQVVLANDNAKPLANAQFIGRGFPQSDRGTFRGVADDEGTLNVERDAVSARVLVESIDKQFAACLELGGAENSKRIEVSPTVNITGRLRDQDGIPLSNASLNYGIELAFPSGGFSMMTSNEAATDEQGNFILKNLCVDVDHAIQMISERDPKGKATSWRPITFVLPKGTESSHMGDIQLPAEPRKRGQTIQEFVVDAFRVGEPFHQRYTQASQDARAADQRLIIVAGSPSTASTIGLYEAIDSSSVYQAFAGYRRLPVDVLGDKKTLTQAMLKALTGQTIDPAKTTLLILDAEKNLHTQTTIEALSDSSESLSGNLVKFLKGE